MSATPGPARQTALGIVAFVATLVLLVGALGIIGRTPAASGRPSDQPTVAPPSVVASGSASGASSSGSSPAPSASDGIGADPVLVGAGDIAACGSDGSASTAAASTARLLDAIGGTVFTAGDNADPAGTARQFTDCYGPTWGRALDRTHPAAGDHDWATQAAAGYLGYFGSRAAPNGPTWYGFDLGTWHVIVLDSDCDHVGGCDAASAQGRWLAADLAADHATCTLAIWHHPRWSSGQAGDHPSVDPFWGALVTAGADVVVNAHDHDYERFAPQDALGRLDAAHGVREFVVGTGGLPLTAFDRVATNSELRVSLAFGVLELTLHRSSYDWRFVAADSPFSDAGTGLCH